MKQLYEVTIRVYVLAHTHAEAKLIGSMECQETEAEAVLATSFDAAWTGCLPYGYERSDGPERTVDQIFADRRPDGAG